MKRITMFLASLMVACGVLVAMPTTANAVDGCSSQVVLKADSWGNTTYYLHPTRTGTDYREIRLVGTTGYYFCPNGTGVNKVKPLWVEWCWSHIDEKSFVFDGVKFNAYFFDDNTDSNPVQVKVDDDGTQQNCKTQNIASDIERWLRMDQSPGWTISSWIVKVGMPDEHWDFRTEMDNKNSTIKYFHPSEDPNLGGWHW